MSHAENQTVSAVNESRLYPLDPAKASQTAAGSVENFQRLLEKSQADPDGFWASVAMELEWSRKWDTVRKGDLRGFEYFSGGISNPCVNLLDRHIAHGMGNKAAMIWEGENLDTRFFTYRMLHAEVCKFANVLKSLGVGKGDPVCMFLPNLPETVVATLACYRLGAVFSGVFSGFSAMALENRIQAFQPKVVITADGGYRRGRAVPLKPVVDEAIKNIPGIQTVIVVKRCGNEVSMASGRDVWWSDVMKGKSMDCEPTPLEANEPGLVFYTSGTTGKPKGVVHAGMGFLANSYIYSKYQMDFHPDDVLWCTADNGWITAHIWGIAGALANGVTTVIFEGALDSPGPERFYEIVEKYRVNKVFTAPTAIRMLMRHGDELPKRYDLSSLAVLALVGEPFNPEAWHWFNDKIGKGAVYINNTWGQTELGGCPLSAAAWLTPMKPGSSGICFLGMKVDVVDDEGKSAPPNVPGNLVVERPFPGMVRTLWNEPDRLFKEYLCQIPGTYFTYDGAIRDEDGHFWVIGRLDDVINIAGHRVSTMEIENAIMTCDSVAEVAVIGAADPLKGLVPVAFVTLKVGVNKGAAVEGDIRQKVDMNLSKIASLGRVLFVDALPKTPSGKIMRRLLRELTETGEVKSDVTGLEDTSTIRHVSRMLKET